jgi:SAM-dependent methyltransferase
MAEIECTASCYLCNSTNLAPLRVPRQWIGEASAFTGLRGELGLSRCKTCGLIFTNPRPSPERLDTFYNGDNYDCHTVSGSSSGNQKAGYLLNVIDKARNHGPKTLLDFGCGSGAFMAAAQELGWKVKGFEPGQRGRTSCASLGFKVAATMDELTGEQFGVITLHHVLEHISDPIQTLSHLRSLLTPDGVLFIEVPNAQSLRARLATDLVRSLSTKVDERYRAFPIHLMYYTRRTLSSVAGRAGFKVQSSSTAGMGMEEFFIKSPAQNGSRQTLPALPPRKVKSTARTFVRDAFLRSMLGENLVIIAAPMR